MNNYTYEGADKAISITGFSRWARSVGGRPETY